MERGRSPVATVIIVASSICMVFVGIASAVTTVVRRSWEIEFLADTATGDIVIGLAFLSLGAVGIVHAVAKGHRPLLRLLAIASGAVGFVACFPIAAIGVVGLYKAVRYEMAASRQWLMAIIVLISTLIAFGSILLAVRAAREKRSS